MEQRVKLTCLRKEPLGRADRGPGLATDRGGGKERFFVAMAGGKEEQGWEAQCLGEQNRLEQELLGADSDTLSGPRSHLAAWGPALLHRHVWSGSGEF